MHVYAARCVALGCDWQLIDSVASVVERADIHAYFGRLGNGHAQSSPGHRVVVWMAEYETDDLNLNPDPPMAGARAELK